MFRLAILITLVNCCYSTFSQQLLFSKTFPSPKKNIPLEIINCASHYFYLLRYNKDAHDITLERRAKPTAEILSFTPLKLDSVNANWFDYERLDHLFFEKQDRVYFLFEKVLNNSKSLYLKSIDTNGRASGFRELLHLEKEKGIADLHLEYKLSSEKNILIISSIFYLNGTVKKTAYLFDTTIGNIKWVKKLPFENAQTGYSTAFVNNEEGQLFYVMAKSILLTFKRKYSNLSQFQIPVFQYESLRLITITEDGSHMFQKLLKTKDFSGLQSISITPIKGDIIFSLHYQLPDSANNQKVCFYCIRLSGNLEIEKFERTSFLTKELDSKLTYFDGTDNESAPDKDFRVLKQNMSDDYILNFSERVEANYYKEILYWKLNTNSGEISQQGLIPRKIFYFSNRSRYKKLGEAAYFNCGNTNYVLLIESRNNEKRLPFDYQFYKYDKQTGLKDGNLVMFKLEANGFLSKNKIYSNSDFDYVPVQYQSNQCDFVFYLGKGKAEKFVMVKPELN